MNTRNWIGRSIHVQECKPYHVFAILIFALLVGILRSFEEVALAHRIYDGAHVLNGCVFYFQMFWVFTFLLALLAGAAWRKVAGIVMVGLLLGALPPLLDALVYGIGKFHYGYIFQIMSLRQALFFDPREGFTIGEGCVLWGLIALSAGYIYLKSLSWMKTLLGAILAYLFILTMGGIIPRSATVLERHLNLSYLNIISILQIGVAVILYLVLNYRLALRLLTRSVYCIPYILLAFIGAMLAGGIKSQTYFAAVLVFLAGIVTLAQNDFFTASEDAMSGRSSYLDRQDVLFLDVIFLAIVLLLYSAESLLYLPLLVLFICSVLYNYDFCRARRCFPGNYLVAGMGGLGSFLAGVMSRELSIFSKEILLYAGLVFGGWALVTTFKDYKDIEADKAVGNQTSYIMLMQAGLSLPQAHRIVSTVITACFLVPVVWIFFQPVPLHWAILFPIVTIGPLLLAFRQPPTNEVRSILLIASVYLFILLLLVFYYVPGKPAYPVYS